MIALVSIGIVLVCGTTWALDEAVLTPTNSNVRPVEDKVFDAAMNVWFSHKYSDGKKLLKEFGCFGCDATEATKMNLNGKRRNRT